MIPNIKKLSWIDRFLRPKGDIMPGFWPLNIWNVSPRFNTYAEDSAKLQAIFSNPALLKVFMLQCELFSMAKVYVYDKNENLVKDDIAIQRINNPNFFQGRSQFLFDYMFWKMAGNAHLYMESDIIERDNAPMYFLEPGKIEWPLSLEKWKDRIVLTQSSMNQILGIELTYRYEDGSVLKFPLKKLSTIQDITNGTGNWFKGNSRVDALYKVLSNSEEALDSKNINVRYSGKFLVAGTQDPKDVSRTPMKEEEKQSIEDKMNGDKRVHAVKSMIDIKRFVEDLRVLELDKSFLADYFLVGMLYNIPRDVLEAYQSSTFENQEKARAGHVSYTLEPAGDKLGDMLAKRWGYDKIGKRIVFSWDHLPFTQVFEKDRVNVKGQQANILNNLLRAYVPLDVINAFLDTEFEIDEAAKQKATETANQQGGAGKSSKAAADQTKVS